MIPKKTKMDLVVESEDIDKGNLYLSGIHGVKHVENLEAVNIKAVVSVVDEYVYKQYKLKELFEHAKIEHLCLVIEDKEEEQISIFFKRTAEFINKYLATGNVAVHCVQGISRSASIVLYYLMESNKWNY